MKGGNVMSYPNIPNITPLISITTEQTIPLLLSSIALEELALAHIMNAEAEKLQLVLGTLTGGTPLSPAEVSLDDLLAVNTSIQRTLRDVIKKEMLLEFKFENILELIEEEVAAFCECTASFIAPPETDFEFGAVTGTGRITRLGTVTGRTRICQDCDPGATELFEFEFTSNTTSFLFEANEYTLTESGALSTCCIDGQFLRFTVTGTGTRNDEIITFELNLFRDIVPPIGNSIIEITLNGNETYQATIAQGNVVLTECEGFTAQPCLEGDS
jgi:hypothetical protein